ncbi:MAG: ABC transporter permease [Chloroflexi bacterium]|nr:ABC transporter permease [Chloroflexota bacterium]
MREYLLQRLLQLVPVLFFLSIIVFTIVRLIPGDPAAIRLGMEATPEGIAAVQKEMGLDKPIFVQYGIWLGDVLRGDFGTSWVSKQPVLQLIMLKLPASLLLACTALLIALLIAIPAGIISGVKQHSLTDNIATTLALLGVAMPQFWLGLMLMLVVAVQLRWLPPSGYVDLNQNPTEAIRRLILPASTLGLTLAAPLARFMRSGMLDVMNADYIRTARAKGLTERMVVTGHAVRNALLTVITVFGMQFGALLGGTIVIEQVFSWPGVGLLAFTAINQRDYGIIQGVVLFVALGFILVNLAVDVIYVYVDPRIRY